MISPTLWGYHKARIPVSQLGLGQPRGQVLDLGEIVTAPFTGAMQKKKEGIGLARLTLRWP